MASPKPKTYSYTFTVAPQMFRRALYFNTFMKQPVQIIIQAAMLILGIGLLVANLVFGVEMSNVMQLCYIVIIAAIPLLIFSCERNYREYRNSPQCDQMRKVSISSEWVKFRVGGNPESEKLEWRLVSSVFELSDYFIFYRDADLMVLLPKEVVPTQDLSELRAIFVTNLGRAYHKRCSE